MQALLGGVGPPWVCAQQGLGADRASLQRVQQGGRRSGGARVPWEARFHDPATQAIHPHSRGARGRMSKHAPLGDHVFVPVTKSVLGKGS